MQIEHAIAPPAIAARQKTRAVWPTGWWLVPGVLIGTAMWVAFFRFIFGLF